MGERWTLCGGSKGAAADALLDLRAMWAQVTVVLGLVRRRIVPVGCAVSSLQIWHMTADDFIFSQIREAMSRWIPARSVRFFRRTHSAHHGNTALHNRLSTKTYC